MLKEPNNYDSVCLVDFGFAIFHDFKKKNFSCGTHTFMAPEMFFKNHGCNFKVDIWALGITTIYLLLGHKASILVNPKTNQLCRDIP